MRYPLQMAEADGASGGSGDFEKVQDFIKDQVKTYFDEMKAKEPAVRQQEPQVTVTEQQQAHKQAGDFIKQFVDSDINDAKFVAADARDYADFYMNNPLAADYKDDVEKAFKVLKDAGRATTRGDILDYVRGRQMRTDPENFTKGEKARQAKQLERADSASDFGAGATARAKSDAVWGNFDSLSVADMEKALEGVTF